MFLKFSLGATHIFFYCQFKSNHSRDIEKHTLHLYLSNFLIFLSNEYLNKYLSITITNLSYQLYIHYTY